MSEMMVIPSSLMAVAKALGMTGQNFMGAKQEAQDSKRKRDMEDLQTFLALMPYMQGGQQPPQQPAQNISFAGLPGLSMAPPNMSTADFQSPAQAQPNIFEAGRVQDIVTRITGMKAPRLGPSAEMRRAETEANVGAATSSSRIANANLQPLVTQSGLETSAAERDAMKYKNAVQPVGDKQKYIAAEAPNYVANAITAETPATNKNRSMLIQRAYQNFINGAPDTPFKSSVRPDDFAGAVDASIAAEKQFELDSQKVRAAAIAAGARGEPDYVKMGEQLRLTLEKRMKDFENQKKTQFALIQMFEADPKNNPLSSEMKADYDEYKNIRNSLSALGEVQAGMMMNGGMPTREDMSALAQAQAAARTNVSGNQGGTPNPTDDGAVDALAQQLRGRDPVAIRAFIAAEVRKGNISQVEGEAVLKKATGGK